jgi:hypothetical protein
MKPELTTFPATFSDEPGLIMEPEICDAEYSIETEV